jgi:hypothetical protein
LIFSHCFPIVFSSFVVKNYLLPFIAIASEDSFVNAKRPFVDVGKPAA